MRLIDADALKEKSHMIEIFDKQWVVDEIEIERAPTVDAVPVVRCGKCALNGNSQIGEGWVFCKNNQQHHQESHYCSYGKRRESETKE